MSFPNREKEKHESRLIDEQDLMSGRKTQEELAKENAFLPHDMCLGRIDFSKIKTL